MSIKSLTKERRSELARFSASLMLAQAAETRQRSLWQWWLESVGKAI